MPAPSITFDVSSSSDSSNDDGVIPSLSSLVKSLTNTTSSEPLPLPSQPPKKQGQQQQLQQQRTEISLGSSDDDLSDSDIGEIAPSLSNLVQKINQQFATLGADNDSSSCSSSSSSSKGSSSSGEDPKTSLSSLVKSLVQQNQVLERSVKRSISTKLSNETLLSMASELEDTNRAEDDTLMRSLSSTINGSFHINDDDNVGDNDKGKQSGENKARIRLSPRLCTKPTSRIKSDVAGATTPTRGSNRKIISRSKVQKRRQKSNNKQSHSNRTGSSGRNGDGRYDDDDNKSKMSHDVLSDSSLDDMELENALGDATGHDEDDDSSDMSRRNSILNKGRDHGDSDSETCTVNTYPRRQSLDTLDNTTVSETSSVDESIPKIKRRNRKNQQATTPKRTLQNKRKHRYTKYGHDTDSDSSFEKDKEERLHSGKKEESSSSPSSNTSNQSQDLVTERT